MGADANESLVCDTAKCLTCWETGTAGCARPTRAGVWVRYTTHSHGREEEIRCIQVNSKKTRHVRVAGVNKRAEHGTRYHLPADRHNHALSTLRTRVVCTVTQCTVDGEELRSPEQAQVEQHFIRGAHWTERWVVPCCPSTLCLEPSEIAWPGAHPRWVEAAPWLHIPHAPATLVWST